MNDELLKVGELAFLSPTIDAACLIVYRGGEGSDPSLPHRGRRRCCPPQRRGHGTKARLSARERSTKARLSAGEHSTKARLI